MSDYIPARPSAFARDLERIERSRDDRRADWARREAGASMAIVMANRCPSST